MSVSETQWLFRLTPVTPPGVQEVGENPFQPHQPIQTLPQNVIPPPQAPVGVVPPQLTYLRPTDPVLHHFAGHQGEPTPILVAQLQPAQAPLIAPQPQRPQLQRPVGIPWLPINLSPNHRTLLTVLGNMPRRSVTVKELHDAWLARYAGMRRPPAYQRIQNIYSVMAGLARDNRTLFTVQRHPILRYELNRPAA
jgi:hypothetical protein